MVEHVVGHQRLHVGDVPLLGRALPQRVDEPRMGDEVALVVHEEAADPRPPARLDGGGQQLVEVAQSHVHPHHCHHLGGRGGLSMSMNM